MKIAIIGNPKSGGGRGAALLEKVAARVRDAGHQPNLLPTERPGHAVELARDKVADAGLVLAVGGDGTLRDVAEGLSKHPGGLDTPVGLIPSGTGNDFARTIGIPRSVELAFDVAMNGETREIDLWTWNDSVFVNAAGVGIDASVADTVNRRFKMLSGMPAYLAGVAAVLPRYRPLKYRVEWPDDHWEGKAWLIACGNGRSYGGGLLIAPNAEPDDGLLDLVIIQETSTASLLRQFPGLFNGTHVRSPDVAVRRVPSVRISGTAHIASIDGEMLQSTPATIGRLPERIRMRVPSAGPAR